MTDALLSLAQQLDRWWRAFRKSRVEKDIARCEDHIRYLEASIAETRRIAQALRVKRATLEDRR